MKNPYTKTIKMNTDKSILDIIRKDKLFVQPIMGHDLSPRNHGYFARYDENEDVLAIIAYNWQTDKWIIIENLEVNVEPIRITDGGIYLYFFVQEKNV